MITTTIRDKFTITRNFDTPPDRVFAAFSSVEAKGRWFIAPAPWTSTGHIMDFRVGGREHVSSGPEGGPMHHYDAQFWDIVPNERITTTYEMYLDDERISVSLATVEFAADGNQNAVTFTEQGAFLDGNPDSPRHREQGSRMLLDQVAAFIEKKLIGALSSCLAWSFDRFVQELIDDSPPKRVALLC